MIKSSIEVIAEAIGYDIGLSDDVVQSDLLNGFSRALATSMQSNHLDTQLCCITNKLTPASIKIIEGLYEFIQLAKENK